MGYMKELSILLEEGGSLEEITDWIIKINMDRNSHISMLQAKVTAQYFYDDWHKGE